MFLAQAILPLVGGLLFQTLEKQAISPPSCASIAGNLPVATISIALWIATEIS
ncbi:MAG: hypothetical protein R2912_01760 [Eubacteriales bacterium]